MQACRARGIVVPPPAALERLCADLRHGARREAHRRLTGRLSAKQRKRLDALTEHREGSSLSWLAWLRQMPEAAKPSAMLGLIERLEHVRAIGIEPGRGHLVHQARLAQLAREARRKTLRRSFDRAAGKSPLHMLHAWSADQRLLLGQLAVDGKSNEAATTSWR